MTQEIKPLTGLRWLAAFGVYIFHFGVPSWYPPILSNLQSNGLLGVQFFFVLSGYVLTTRYLGRPLTARDFAVARFARIGPMYYFGLLLSLAYYFSTRTEPFKGSQLALHALGLQAWNGELDNAILFNGPAWTISVEILFYSLFPLLVRLTSRHISSSTRSIGLMLIGAIYGAVLTGLHCIRFGAIDDSATEIPNGFMWFAFIPVFYLGLFLTGMGAAYLARSVQVHQQETLINQFLRPSIFAFVILFSITFTNLNSIDRPYLAIFVRFSVSALPVGLLLASLHLRQNDPLGKFLGSGPLVMLGRVSYTFYIIHVPYVFIVRTLKPELNYEIVFLSLLGVAILAYYMIEQPLRMWLISLNTGHQFTQGAAN